MKTEIIFLLYFFPALRRKASPRNKKYCRRFEKEPAAVFLIFCVFYPPISTLGVKPAGTSVTTQPKTTVSPTAS